MILICLCTLLSVIQVKCHSDSSDAAYEDDLRIESQQERLHHPNPEHMLQSSEPSSPHTRYDAVFYDDSGSNMFETIRESQDPRTLRNMRILKTSFPEFPADVMTKLTGIRRITIFGTTLTTLPAETIHLTHLRNLNLSRGILTAFPPVICSIPSLITLNLSSNNITDIPDTLDALQHLRRINLSNNNIQEIPQSMGRLRSAIYFNFRNNSLTTLPTSFRAFKGTSTKIYLEGNNIADHGDGSSLGKRELIGIFKNNVFFSRNHAAVSE